MHVYRKPHHRNGYTRGDGVRVKACNVRGCKVRLPKARQGQLTKYGYHLDRPSVDRLQALLRGVTKDGYATIMRRLNWLAVMSKKRPTAYKKIQKDMSDLRDLLRP